MTFQLDTSGTVHIAGDEVLSHVWHWDELDDFTQGYVEALLLSFYRQEQEAARIRYGVVPLEAFARYGFSDLAPETLAQIIADCEAFRQTPPFVALCAKIVLHDREMMNAGAEFWHVRARLEDYCHGFKAGDWPQFTTEPLNIAARAFPPLTVQLGDDGNVRFAA